MEQFPVRALPEFAIFKKLSTPEKIQDFLGTLPFNFEERGDTMRSPLETLKHGKAHCLEGALLAAAALWYHGEKPLLLDLETSKKEPDQPHVVALFKRYGLWGAVSKTNHAVLRYRDPVYKNIRELVMSYFNEYFLDTGVKTLRSYSRPLSLLEFEDAWLTSPEDVWGIEEALEKQRHLRIAPERAMRRLRRTDRIERQAGKLFEY